jgi:hypothetical protein
MAFTSHGTGAMSRSFYGAIVRLLILTGQRRGKDERRRGVRQAAPSCF